MKFIGAVISLAVATFATVFMWPSHDVTRPDATSVPSRAETFRCTVTKVHDGDGPIWCAEGPRIRLTAVAARELDETCSPGHPCPAASGASAQRRLQELASGRVLRCEQTGTSYNRVTAWCWREDGLELNCAMVESGHALHWQKFDPDQRLCARQNRIG